MASESVLHTSWFFVLHLGSLAVIAGSAWVFGDAALHRLRVDEGGAGRWALASALGLGLMAQALFVVGFLGLFNRGFVLGLLAAAHLLCRAAWRRGAGALWRAWRPGGRRVFHLAVAAAGAVPLAAMAFYPPTGWDATVYHLPYVKAFLESGRLAFVSELRFPVFPQVAEMGFLLGFFLSGVTAAKLTQTLSMFLTAALVLAWGRRFYSRRVGLWAAALWLGTPLVLWIGSLAYVDVELALFVTAALYSWERWHQADAGRSPAVRWLWLAGAYAGLAAGTKYLGLFFCAALAVLSAARVWKQRSVRPWAVLAASMALFLGPWYLRNLYHTGNPVFPFYAPIFGESEWTSHHDKEVLRDDAERPASGEPGGITGVVARQSSRIAEGLGFLLLVPWNGVFHREIFHHQAPLTPLYVLLIPLCVPWALRRPQARRLLGLTAAYGVFWLAIVHDLRFFLPVFPLLNLALASGLERWTRRWARPSFAAAMAVVLLGPGLFYGAYKLWERGKLPVTAEARQDDLSREVPGYPAIRLLNESRGSRYTVYGLFTSRLSYYADGRYLGDLTGPYGHDRVLAVLDDSRALYRELEEIGAGFFLVRTTDRRAVLPRDADFERRFRLVWHDAAYALYEVGQANRDNPGP